MRCLPSLKALRTFDAVARFDSMTAAAGELSVTPGAVSRQIGNLENDVGIALLKRSGGGCCLTEDGRRLAQGLNGAFSTIAEAVDDLRQSMHGKALRVRVGLMLAHAWLIPRLDRFSRLVPDTEVVIVGQNGRAHDLEDAELAIDWGRFRDSERQVVERLSGPEEIFPVCRPQVCGVGSLDGSTLLGHECVGSAWDWPDWSTFLEAVGLDVCPGAYGPRLTGGLLLNAAREGKGVALACTSIAHDDILSGRLERPIAGSMATGNGYWLLMGRKTHKQPHVVAFRDWLLAEFDACFRGGGEVIGARQRRRPDDSVSPTRKVTHSDILPSGQCREEPALGVGDAVPRIREAVAHRSDAAGGVIVSAIQAGIAALPQTPRRWRAGRSRHPSVH